MNSFASTQTSPGILKDAYGGSGLEEALARKRQKLAETRLGLEVNPEEQLQDQIKKDAKSP